MSYYPTPDQYRELGDIMISQGFTAHGRDITANAELLAATAPLVPGMTHEALARQIERSRGDRDLTALLCRIFDGINRSVGGKPL